MVKMKFVAKIHDSRFEIRLGGIHIGGGEFFNSDFKNEVGRFGGDFSLTLRPLPLGEGTRFLQQGIFKLFTLRLIPLRDGFGERAHATEKRLPFGDADCAARVEDVEAMRAFQNVIVRGED